MSNIPDEILSEIGPIVESVAYDMHRRYSRYGAEREDFVQQGHLWVFQHPKALLGWIEEYEPKVWTRLLARSLRNEVFNYGEDLKAQKLGYHRDDLAYYTRGMVRELLPAMFDPEAWLNPEVSDSGERRQKSVPAEGGNWVATLADVSQAYAKMEPEDRDLLAAFHRDNWTNKMLAEAYGLSKQTMSDRHDRAIRRLVDLLGGPRPQWEHSPDCEHPFSGWVGRRAVSNSAARQQLESYWDEEN